MKGDMMQVKIQLLNIGLLQYYKVYWIHVPKRCFQREKEKKDNERVL